jgi:hypothetical protein
MPKGLLGDLDLAHGLDHCAARGQGHLGLPQLGDYLFRGVFLPRHFAPFRVRPSLTSDLDRISGTGHPSQLKKLFRPDDRRETFDIVTPAFGINRQPPAHQR